jgi:putative transposase
MLVCVKRIERIRLYPTARRAVALAVMLDVTRELYNALLQQRRDAYRLRRVTVTAKMQHAEMTALRAEDARVRAVYRESQDAVLHRLGLAMAAFFRRCKCGEKAGHPRFKSRRRWKQVEFPHGDRALRFDQAQQRVKIPSVGVVKLRKGRQIPATYKRAWVVRKNDRWYASFECERAPMQQREKNARPRPRGCSVNSTQQRCTMARGGSSTAGSIAASKRANAWRGRRNEKPMRGATMPIRSPAGWSTVPM